MSSESASVPVEASVEDLHGIPAPPQCIQSDAWAVSAPLALEAKLNQELQYHKLGNYSSNTQSDIANGNFGSTSDPFLANLLPVHTVTPSGQDRLPSSSVHSFTKAEPVHPSSQGECWYHPSGDRSLSMQPPKPRLSASFSLPSLPQPNQEHHFHSFDRQTSWSTVPVTDTSAPGSLLAPSNSRLLKDQGGSANPCTWRDLYSDTLMLLLDLTDMD